MLVPILARVLVPILVLTSVPVPVAHLELNTPRGYSASP